HKVVEKVARRHWPRDTEFRVLTVVEPVTLEEYGKGKWGEVIAEVVERRKHEALNLCDQARQKLTGHIPDSIVHYEVREGSPKAQIVDAAIDWSADKIVIGAHGKGVCPRFLLGSVSRAVAAHAPCSVEIIRAKSVVQPALGQDKAATEKTPASV
ncbi:MAG: universal stress protein, partial [Candidatus Melainabacteria bacterium]|nr:universal stress protein [Candidatus Melainabacteria bacterium]